MCQGPLSSSLVVLGLSQVRTCAVETSQKLDERELLSVSLFPSRLVTLGEAAAPKLTASQPHAE